MLLQNRAVAGKMLAEQLLEYKDERPIVLALPRGGVVIAGEVARALASPVDIIAVRKIHHPVSEEFAIGAIDDSGRVIFNRTEAAALERSWLLEEVEKEHKEAIRRATLYRGGKNPLPLAGKTIIIVDDGMATGLTMRLAVIAAQVQNPARVIVAVPVASPESVASLRNLEAEVFVLQPPEEFGGSVGNHYQEFDQVKDDEVIKILKRFV